MNQIFDQLDGLGSVLSILVVCIIHEYRTLLWHLSGGNTHNTRWADHRS